MSICQRPLFVRQAERCVSLKRRCYVVCTRGACFQRFKVSRFHRFAVSRDGVMLCTPVAQCCFEMLKMTDKCAF